MDEPCTEQWCKRAEKSTVTVPLTVFFNWLQLLFLVPKSVIKVCLAHSETALPSWCIKIGAHITWWHRESVPELGAHRRSNGEVIFSLVLWADSLHCWHSRKTRHRKQIGSSLHLIWLLPFLVFWVLDLASAATVGLHSACFLLYPTQSFFTQQKSPSTLEIFFRKITPKC